MILINDLEINDNIHYKFNEKENSNDKTYLRDLSKINIFIGSNNSGKSRLLRYFFNSKVKFTRKYESLLDNDEDLAELCGNTFKYFSENYTRNFDEIKKVFDLFKSNLEKGNKKSIPDNLREIWTENKKLEQANKDGENDNTFHENKPNKHVRNTVQRFNKKIDEYFSGIIGVVGVEDEHSKYNFKRIYIPILRGLRHLNDENKDFYYDRTNEDYFDNSLNSGNKIFTGLNYYDILRKYLLGNLKQRELINNYQKYLSETFFDGKEVVLIPREKDDKEKNRIIWVKIGNEKEKPIYGLGDGIQAIIIITLPLFLNFKDFGKNDNVLVFIEEPEQHLHPGLQKRLIETFLDKRFENYQFFFTTHSNHFLDIILHNNEDISIFSFEKKLEDKNIEEEPTFDVNKIFPDNSSIFENLGVLPSSVFIANSNIVVEGTSDKLYYKKYLNIYQEQDKNLKYFKEENYDYNFIISCGSEIKNLLENLNDKQKEMMFFIVDSDDNLEKKKKMFKKNNCKTFHVTNGRTVENLLSKDVINRIIDNHDDAKKIEDRNDFNERDYQKEKLAKFMDEKILNSKKPIFANEKGSFDNKVKFAQKALKNINRFDDLSEEAKDIAKKIHDFIKSKTFT
ncbi:MAG: ATP-binding protein [Methanobrevibacter sp.]|jgi:predicted ATP-dependent endonuclease of OLD family|nr:ATP-binding protein [Methanobrevibacter sp.]